MGQWQQETRLYGEQERWIPDHRGDWPADAIGAIPCPVCWGELTRRVVYPNAAELERERVRREKQAQSLRARGQQVPELPPLPEPSAQWLYSLACYRSLHKISAGAHAPSLQLVPADRTADWADR